jgi:hypothetical protein
MCIWDKIIFIGFEVFTAVTMKNAVIWDVAPCRSCLDRRFGGTYRLHLQGRKIRERGPSVACSHLLTLVPHSRTFLPWRWRRYVPPKRRFTQELHGVTSQKTAFFKIAFVHRVSLRIWTPFIQSSAVTCLHVHRFTFFYPQWRRPQIVSKRR